MTCKYNIRLFFRKPHLYADRLCSENKFSGENNSFLQKAFSMCQYITKISL